MISELYRIRHGAKISSLRLVGYALFGVIVSGAFRDVALDRVLVGFTVNTLIILFGLLHASLLNDYYDYLYLGEHNSVSRFLENNVQIPFVHMLIWFPWVIAFIFFLSLSHMGLGGQAFILLWVIFLLNVLYSAPPFRLKNNKIFGLVLPPLGIFLLFLEPFSLFGWPRDGLAYIIAGVVFLFAWYLEFLHLLDDSLQKHEIHKIPTRTARIGLIIIASYGAVMGIVLSFWYGVLAISGVMWSLRLWAVISSSDKELVSARRNILHPIWRLEEFACYALFLMMV